MINGMLGTSFSRRPIKDTGFGLIYGMGLDKLAFKTGTDKDTAKTIRDAYLEIAPGIKNLSREFKRRAAAKEPIRTWGDREYFVEPPAVRNGRLMQFDYKLLNILIQGSAADCTKDAIIILHDDPRWHRLDAWFDVQVHDELLGEAAKAAAREAMVVMREAMESVEFDVPMLSEGEWGRAWASLDEFDDGRRKKAA
jgi:DNA polymerase-1